MSEYQRMFRTLRASNCVSFWLKRALIDLYVRDPVDALADAEQLVEVCRQRVQDTLGGAQRRVDSAKRAAARGMPVNS